MDDEQLGEFLRVGASSIHGKGVFAREFINSGAYLGTYDGPETLDNDIYVLWVEDEAGQWRGRDGKNLLRYLNHSAEPNAEFEGYRLLSLVDIQEGEEICFYYGDEFEQSLEEVG